MSDKLTLQEFTEKDIEELQELFRKAELCKDGKEHDWQNVSLKPCCSSHTRYGEPQDFECSVCKKTKRGTC